MATTAKVLDYRAAGSNLEAASDDEFAYLRFPLDRTKTIGDSASGKTAMLAKTDGGWATLPGTDVRFNLQAGYRNAKTVA